MGERDKATAAVVALLHRYCELQDAADFPAVAELFRHAAYAVQGGATHHGYDEVLAVKTHHDRVHEDGTLRTQHVTSNTIVEWGDRDDEVRTRSYFTVFQSTAGLPFQAVIGGRYHDTFERVDGTWRFRERRILSDLVGDLTQHLRDNPLERS
jgi:3-phenylpropionate/cinnamic acid dioxygenase small subunit